MGCGASVEASTKDVREEADDVQKIQGYSYKDLKSVFQYSCDTGIQWLRPDAFQQLLTRYGKLLRQQDIVAKHAEMLIEAEDMQQMIEIIKPGNRLKLRQLPLSIYESPSCVKEICKLNFGDEILFAGAPEVRPGDRAYGIHMVKVEPTGYAVTDEIQKYVIGLPLVISHPWLAKGHPDPFGDHLRDLVEYLGSQLVYNVLGVFIDFASLPQLPRSQEQDIAFRKALSHMDLLYAHNMTLVLIMDYPTPTNAMNRLEYEVRGWCRFECFSAAMKADSHLAVSLLSGSKPMRYAVRTPDRFNLELETLVFSNKHVDKMIVSELYARLYANKFMRGVDVLVVCDLIDSEVEVFIESMNDFGGAALYFTRTGLNRAHRFANRGDALSVAGAEAIAIALKRRGLQNLLCVDWYGERCAQSLILENAVRELPSTSFRIYTDR